MHACSRSTANTGDEAAFTLIEMSIVLVIIGLVVGGVLVGQSLIHTAALRSQIKQLQDYQTAFNTFKIKYNCIPGDCANATIVVGTGDSLGNVVTNGNGNGLIDTSTGTDYDTGVPWSASTELQGVLQELAMAHMINFVPPSPASYLIGKSHPSVNLNTSAGFFIGASYNFTTGGPTGRNPDMEYYRTGTNAIWLVDCASTTAGDSMNGWDDNCAIFLASDLSAIDLKIDDGLPLSGTFFGFGGYATNNNCLTGNAYNTSINTLQCQAAFVIN